MKFLADEGVDFPLIQRIREEGFRVTYAAEEFPGVSDDMVLKRAEQENCILITKDKDFGVLVIHKRKTTAGVILIRIEELNVPANCTLVVSLIRAYIGELYAVLQ